MSDKILVLVTGVPRIISRVSRIPKTNRIDRLYYMSKNGKHEHEMKFKPNHQLVQMTRAGFETLLKLRRDVKVAKVIYRDHIQTYLIMDWVEKYGEFE